MGLALAWLVAQSRREPVHGLRRIALLEHEHNAGDDEKRGEPAAKTAFLDPAVDAAADDQPALMRNTRPTATAAPRQSDTAAVVGSRQPRNSMASTRRPSVRCVASAVTSANSAILTAG